jgi:hypothetical protein
MMDNIDDLLPATLLDIKQNFGLDVMLKIWTTFRGQNIYVQKNLKPDHPLVEALGLELAHKFSKHYQEKIHIDTAIKLQRAIRNQMILDLSTKGIPQNQIATTVNLDVNSVQKILYNMRNASKSPQTKKKPLQFKPISNAQKQQDLFFNL